MGPSRRLAISGTSLAGKLAPTGLALAVVGLHFIVPGGVPLWQRALGSFSGAVMAFLSSRYLSRSNYDRLPYLEFTLIQVYMFWGLPTLFPTVTERYPVHMNGLTLALYAVILFVVFMVAFFPLGMTMGKRAQSTISKAFPGEVGVGMSLLYWPWLLLTMFGNTGLTTRLPRSLMHPFVAISSYFPLLSYTSILTQRDRARAWLFPMATILLAFSGMLSGRMRYVLLPIIISAVISLISNRSFPWRIIAIVLALFIVLQPAKHAYRALAWSDSEHRQTFDVELTANRWLEALVTTWQPEESGEEESKTSYTSRLNILAPISLVFEMVPGMVPHVGADHWKLLLVAPLPRFLYPDKPNFTERLNQYYGLTFNIQTERDVRSTTAAFPLVSDGYWCFGWPGVAFVGALGGLLLGFSSRCFNLHNWSGLSFALVMFADLRPINNLVGMLGGMIQRIVGLLVILWIIWLFSLGFSNRARRLIPPQRSPLPGPPPAKGP